jgi:hypothetical protein
MPTASSGLDFARLLRQLIAWVVVLLVLGMGVGFLVQGTPGLLGGTIGAGVTLVFCGTTAGVMGATMHRPVATQSALLVVSWIAKMIVLLAVFIAVDAVDSVSRPVLGVTVLVGVVGSLVLDIRLVLRSRVSPGE